MASIFFNTANKARIGNMESDILQIKNMQITLMNYNTDRVICDYDRVNIKYQQYYEMGYFDGMNSTFDNRYRKCITINGIIAYVPYPAGCEAESNGTLMDHDKFWSSEEW